jgi:hypothetical protein
VARLWLRAVGRDGRGVPRIDGGMEAGAGVQNFREGEGEGGFARRSGSGRNGCGDEVVCGGRLGRDVVCVLWMIWRLDLRCENGGVQ